MSFASEVAADSPLAWYRLTEQAGVTMVDASGNGRNGTYAATPNRGPGVVYNGDGASVDFNKDNFGRVTKAAWMDVQNLTVEVWYNADGTNSAGAWLFSHATANGGTTATDRSWWMAVDSSGLVHFGLTFTDTTALTGYVDTYPLYGVNRHIVATWDGTWLRVYVNGVQAYANNSMAGKTVRTNTADLTVGSDSSSSNYATTKADARIDEAIFYGTALSAARVLAHYQAGSPSSAGTPTTYESAVLADNPLVYWKLDEGRLSAYDSSGNGRHGTYNGSQSGPALVAGSTQGTLFSGNALTIPGAAWMDSTQMSVECWISSESTEAFMSRASGGSATGWIVYYATPSAASPGRVMFQLISAGSQVAACFGSTGVVDGKPHHVVATYDGATMKVYVDGQLDGSQAYATGLPISTGQPLNCGGWSSGISHYLTGLYDEFAFYGSALSAARVLAHYNAGKNGAVVRAGGTSLPSPKAVILGTTKLPSFAYRGRDLKTLDAGAA